MALTYSLQLESFAIRWQIQNIYNEESKDAVPYKVTTKYDILPYISTVRCGFNINDCRNDCL